MVRQRKQEPAIRAILKLALVIVIALTIRPAPHLKAAEQHQAPIPKTVATSQPVLPPKIETAAAVTPVTTPPPPVTPTYPVSCAAYEPIVAQYEWNTRVAMAIMQAESGCNPYAISPANLNYDGVSDYGLFQIHGQYVLNPTDNIAIAYHKYQSQGWQAWSSYNSGAVWRYY